MGLFSASDAAPLVLFENHTRLHSRYDLESVLCYWGKSIIPTRPTIPIKTLQRGSITLTY